MLIQTGFVTFLTAIQATRTTSNNKQKKGNVFVVIFFVVIVVALMLALMILILLLFQHPIEKQFANKHLHTTSNSANDQQH